MGGDETAGGHSPDKAKILHVQPEMDLQIFPQHAEGFQRRWPASRVTPLNPSPD
jgi:hypothetical protein